MGFLFEINALARLATFRENWIDMLERTKHRLDADGAALGSRLLCGRLSAHRPVLRCCMHYAFGYQPMAAVDTLSPPTTLWRRLGVVSGVV